MKVISKALFVGINYSNDPNSVLYNCVKDAEDIRDFMLQTFQINKFVILTDHEPHNRHPTRANILMYLHWLTEIEKDEIVFFSYSGHGSLKSRDNIYAMLNKIIPLDHHNGSIDDNHLNNIMTTIINKNAIMYSIIDACHSGSICKLKYALREHENKEIIIDTYVNVAIPCVAGAGKTVCISSCQDEETSSDGINNGFLTTGFLKYVKNKIYDLTELLKLINSDSDNQKAQISSNKIEYLKEYLFKELLLIE